MSRSSTTTLMSLLRCWSLYLHIVKCNPSLHPNELKPCILANHISPFNHVVNRPPKSHMAHARCHFPYNQSLLYRWLMTTQLKLTNNRYQNENLSTCLDANARAYMIYIKDTTCRKQDKLTLLLPYVIYVAIPWSLPFVLSMIYSDSGKD